MSNARTFLQVYDLVLNTGKVLSPRGDKIRETRNVQFELDMNDNICTSFKARKFNLDYAKKEFIWYLGGDRFDDSIEKYASLWPKLKQDDGSYFSNYGHYLFAEGQVKWALNQIVNDIDTRRASCVLLCLEHLFDDNKDMVCTYGLNFAIRENRLDMSVSMRSNDLVFGTTNDVFCFSMLYEIAYGYLKFIKYPDLERGTYCHKVDSLHIYERHWTMVRQILTDGMSGYYFIDIPRISGFSEANRLLNYHMSLNTPLQYRDAFSIWLFS
jgi:thymidylate synthase